jgi:protein-disulfide isomerase
MNGKDLVPEPSRSDHVRGSLDAPAVITEFGDFECPFCGAAYGVLEMLRKNYGDRMALVFRHFPLPMHPHAMAAAEAAEAAGSAGKFWEMYDELYLHQAHLTVSDLRHYAKASGVPEDDVTTAIQNGTYRERITRDQRSGEESGVEGTPWLFVNGFTYDGEVTVEALTAKIDDVIAYVRK